jgi:hypothetical protein
MRSPSVVAAAIVIACGQSDPPLSPTPTGNVAAVGSGSQMETGDSKLRISHLDKLTQRTDGITPAELTLQGLARSPSMVYVVVPGSQYKLFTQPCCGQRVRQPAPAAGSGDGWVLRGLIAQRALSVDSYAVSSSILVLLSAVLLLGLLSWPFLKLMLLGEAQRVKAHDIVLVAICTLLGIWLVTIGTLDFFAYSRRLRSALDVCTDGAVGIVNVVSLVERRV